MQCRDQMTECNARRSDQMSIKITCNSSRQKYICFVFTEKNETNGTYQQVESYQNNLKNVWNQYNNYQIIPEKEENRYNWSW